MLARAWAELRRPFEPTGNARADREQLRSAICQLESRYVLHAEYVSADTSRCDVENITLYNVGALPFEVRGERALRIERPHDWSSKPQQRYHSRRLSRATDAPAQDGDKATMR